MEVDGKPVNDVDSLKTLMDQIAKEQKSTVVMKVLRGIHTAFSNWAVLEEMRSYGQ